MELRRLIVPLDGSEFAERAVPVAAGIAASVGAGLTLVTTRWDGDQHTPADYLELVRGSIAGVDVEPVLIHDRDAPDAIEITARARPGSLVCMTTHGRSGLGQAVLGSVAEAVVRRSTEPVLLVGPHCLPAWPDDAKHLLVCVDGSSRSDSLVDAATDWARALALEVTVGMAIHPLDVEDAVHPELVMGPFEERVRSHGVVAHSAVVRGGFVPATLVDLATELPAAMVAMSTRARTGAARALLGSVTSAVVHRAHAPVLVLHP